MNVKNSEVISIVSVLIIVIVAAVFLVSNNPDKSVLKERSDITPELLFDATVHVPELDMDVELSQGQGEFTVLDTPVVGYVAIGKNIATSSSLAVSTLAVNGGGSGVFEYLALFKKNTRGEIEHTSSVFIGDRVDIKSIEFVADSSGKPTGVKVSFLDRLPDDAMSETPTVPSTLDFEIVDSKFAE